MANRDRGQSNRGSSNKASPWAVGLGAVALGAVAAVGGYLLGKSNAEEEAEIAQLRQQHERGFLPTTPKRQQSNNGTRTTTATTTSTANPQNPSSGVCKDQDGNQECAICLRSYQELNKLEEEIHTTPCGHVFCYTCISQSLPSRPKCPICNNPVKPGQTMRLYL